MTDSRDRMKEDKKVLKWILAQTYRAREKRRRLDNRLAIIRYEMMNAPISGSGFDPAPAHSGSAGDSAVTGIIIQMSEIEARISEQKKEVAKSIIEIMDILTNLPEGSLEKEICEMRHIDLMSWKDIQSAIPMSKSQCFNRYNAALEILLGNPDVQLLVAKRAGEYNQYKKIRASGWKNSGAK